MYKSASALLFNRPDTLLGVCEGVGQEFGFHPNFLRIGFALFLLVNPVAVIATYLALGVAVAVSRLLMPVKRPQAVQPATACETASEDEPVALAA